MIIPVNMPMAFSQVGRAAARRESDLMNEPDEPDEYLRHLIALTQEDRHRGHRCCDSALSATVGQLITGRQSDRLRAR
jgi:hypothetical protein